jgi:preprotein translocase subunit SecG
MTTILLIVHLIVCATMVGVILLQRSEGGALGIGGGGGGGGFMTGRSAGNALTKATAMLAVAFFATSMGLTLIAKQQTAPASILDQAPTTAPSPFDPLAPTPPTLPGPDAPQP